MNRRDLLKTFGAAGIAISVPKVMAESSVPTIMTKEEVVANIVTASDKIVLDLNKMPCISIRAETDNNVVVNHVVGSFETYPMLGRCDQTIHVECYVDENIRTLFNALDQHRVRVFYRQPKHPTAPLQPDDPVLFDTEALLVEMNIDVASAQFDAVANLVLRTIKS